jgi:putative DNA primase/helicase
VTAPLPPVPAQPFRVPGPANHPGNARAFLDFFYTHPDGYRLLISHRQKWLWWTGCFWEEISSELLEQKLSWYFQNAEWWKVPAPTNAQPNPQGAMVPFVVNNDALTNLLRAVRNETVIDDRINFNTWLDTERGDPDPKDVVPVQNGLLHTGTRVLMDPTPRYFNPYALDFMYDPSAPQPMQFWAFLRSVFGDDADRIRLVQEMLGYLATPRTDLHKLFVLTGPTRSGKGTIARLVKRLVGEDNFGATTLTELTESHGMEDIADKPVVLMGDTAYSGGAKAGQALERLLGVVGEDAVPVNPKNKKRYTAKLPCRFMILGNWVPDLPDKAQALRARTLHLKFTKSFLGEEDEELDAKIHAEIAGIFNWALSGLDALRLRRKFIQPELGLEDLDINTRLVSPETSFVQDLCEVSPDDPACRDSTADMYLAWSNWCLENGHRSGSKEHFVRGIRRVADCGHVKGGKMPRGADGKQANAQIGIRLSAEARGQYLMDEISFKMSHMGNLPPTNHANTQDF